MTTTTLKSTETEPTARTEKPTDKRGEIVDIPISETALGRDSDDEYIPPVLPEKKFEFKFSSETILSLAIDSPSAEKIDSIIFDQRENDSATIAEKVDTILDKARQSLEDYEKAKAVAKAQLAVDNEHKNVDQQSSTAAQGPEQEANQDIDASAKEIIATYESQTARKKALELKIRDLKQDIKETRLRLDSRQYITEEEGEAMAKDGKKGLGHKLKSRFSDTYRTEEIGQYRQKTIDELEKELAIQEASLQEESAEIEETNQKLESLFTGDIPAKDFETTAISTIEKIKQLDDELKKSGKEPIELLDSALSIDSLDTSLQSRIDTILSRVKLLKDSGDFKKLPTDLQNTLTNNLNLEYIMGELKITRSITKDGSVISREMVLDQYAKSEASNMIDNFFKEQVYGDNMCDPIMSDELKFTPTIEQLQAVEALMSDGVTLETRTIEVFSHSRERLELVANADRSFIAHVSTVNRALQIIESGGIKSPDMIAAERGGEASDYSNSPHGQHSGIVGESYFTLNNFECAYIATSRYDSKYRFENMIDNPEGDLGAVFVSNFGVIGSEKAWYMRQNSQGKPNGAEEVVIIMDSPLPIDEMYIFIEDTPKAVEFYTDALTKSGRTEEWIKEHLVPIKGIKTPSYGRNIGNGQGGRDVIYRECIARGILGQSSDKYVSILGETVKSQTNGSMAQTYKLKNVS